jgi:hypothetical protein
MLDENVEADVFRTSGADVRDIIDGQYDSGSSATFVKHDIVIHRSRVIPSLLST